MAMTIEIGVARSVELPTRLNNTIEIPSEESQAESTRVELLDMRGVHNGLRRAKMDGDIELMLINSYSPYGPSGGVAGGVWEIVVDVEF